MKIQPGFRFDSIEEIANRDTFIGIDKLKRRLKKIELLLGLSEEYPIYANNAAAITGGLKTGDRYRTATGSLMIVFTP